MRHIAESSGAPSESPPRSSDVDIHALDRGLLSAVERFFAGLAEERPSIDVQCLKRALGIQSDELAARVLTAFDRDRDGSIDRDDFIQSIRRLVRGTPDRS